MTNSAQIRDAIRASDLRSVGKICLPALGLGCAQLGGLFQAMDLAESFDLLGAAWRAGIRYFDTAPYYGYTKSERRVGCFLSERDRTALKVSTKVGRLMTPASSVGSEEFGYVAPLPFPPVYAYGYDDILRSFEHSQQRLGLVHVDLLYVHDIGRLTHGERHDVHWNALTRGGGFRALRRLRDEGSIGGFGLGVNEAAVVSEAMSEVHLDAVLLAGRHTLLDQGALPLLDACARCGTAVVAAGPFNSGILAGGSTFDYTAAPAAVVERARALEAVADRFGVPLPAAALQFPLAHPAVVSVVAGAHSAAQVEANVAAFERVLPAAFWTALREEELVAPAAPLPAGA